MTLRRAVVAALGVAALALAAGCGDDDSADDSGADYADEVEAIMDEQVTPAGIAATDAITNVAQGETDIDAVLAELDRATAELRDAEAALAALEPPEGAVAQTAEELVARLGLLADRLEDTGAAELERDPVIAAENVRTDLDRIERRAQEIEELSGGGAG